MKKIATSMATAALLTLSVVPGAFAATDVHVAGNGAFSDNTVTVSNSCTTTVDQTNNTTVNNNVVNNLNTGGNSASFNTGGSVTIITGDATSNTEVSNVAGLNAADVEGCVNEAADILVHGNGAFSDNTVSVRNWTREEFKQYNRTRFWNSIVNNQNTGNNSANFNTGTDVVIMTGDATSNTTVQNTAGSNVLH